MTRTKAKGLIRGKKAGRWKTVGRMRGRRMEWWLDQKFPGESKETTGGYWEERQPKKKGSSWIYSCKSGYWAGGDVTLR